MNQIVIIGGGSSIIEGVNKDLWNKLSSRWTLGCNSAFKFITPSALVFVDHRQFYKLFYDELGNLPLIIGKSDNKGVPKLPNTIFLRDSQYFDRSLATGVYSGTLCGLFSLTLATRFLIDGGEIFLLGFDFGAGEKLIEGRQHTHFYQEQGEIKHRGIGYTGWYKKADKTSTFVPYSKLENLKIWNVSMDSAIPFFEKISYDLFFEKLNTEYDQMEQRKYMLEVLGVKGWF